MILLLLGTLTVTTIAAPFSGQQQPQQQKENVDQLIAVSYTHLTLPTIYSV